MRRTFVLPPSLESQQQRTAHPRSKPLSNQRQDTPYTRVTTSRHPPVSSGSLSSPQVSTSSTLVYKSTDNSSTTRQPLKRKLIDERTEDQHQVTHVVSGDPSSKDPSSGDIDQLHVASEQTQTWTSSGSLNAANFMQGFSVNGPQSHNHARTLPNRSLPSVGSSRTLADRKLVAISEISRRFVIGSRSQHPNPAAAHDPTKHRKPSGLARNIILPTTNTGVSSAKSKRKTKFTPPLVSGGYAERLANLMSYHRSEYSMWANATLRQDKLFGSTEPLAVVEITDLSMDHHLQWAQCKVIHSEHNRPPFDTDASLDRTNDDERLEDCVSQTQPNDTSEAVNEPETDIVTSTPCHLIDGFVVEEEEEDDAASDGVEITGSTVVEIVTSTPPDCIGGFTENDSMVGTYTEEDSINGLHMDVHKMGVVSSSQGSVPGSSMGSLFKSQQHWTMHEAAKLHSIVEDEPPTKLVQILKSSQGSEDEAEWNESLLEEVSVFPKQILAKDHRLRKSSPVKQYSPQGDVPEGDRSMESGPAMSSETDPVLKTMSVGSVIDDKSSESDGGTMGMIFTPQENPTLSASTPHTATTGPTFTIIFSKLFNCATLKVTDKVEIHEPCHRIVTPDCGESAHDSAVWIVERYKVVSD